MTERVLIAQPVRIYSHQFARALHEGGYEVHFWTLLPDENGFSYDCITPRWMASRYAHNGLGFLPPHRKRWLPGALLLEKLTFGSPNAALARGGEWASRTLFDLWVSGSLSELRPNLLVGSEMSCARSFAVARKLGIRCLLDSAAEHFSLQRRTLQQERDVSRTWAGRALALQKLREVDRAEFISVCSPQSAQSYLESGVQPSRLCVNPLGVDLDLFGSPAKSRTGAAQFLFIGNPRPYKGLDILLACFQHFATRNPGVRLHVVGDAGRLLPATKPEWLRVHGKLSHRQISMLMTELDCLVMPSRLESFGMVAVEALAGGLAVLLSDKVGAVGVLPESFVCRKFLSEDLRSLTLGLHEVNRDVEVIRTMASAAREIAARFAWSAYQDRARALVKQILA